MRRPQQLGRCTEMNDRRPELSGHLFDERDISGQKERQRLRGRPDCRQDRGSISHRELSWKDTVSHENPDVIDAQAGYRVSFGWRRYLVDLRQHSGNPSGRICIEPYLVMPEDPLFAAHQPGAPCLLRV